MIRNIYIYISLWELYKHPGKALGGAWQPTFDARPFHLDTAQDFLSPAAADGALRSFGPIEPPEPFDFMRTIRSLHDSAPGPDQLTYSAWRATGALGA